MNIRPILKTYLPDINELKYEIDKLKNAPNDQNNSSTKNTSRSRIEQALLKALEPINLNEKEETMALGERGIWLNREEALNWHGPIPLSQYKLNEDPNPEIITKKLLQPVEYTQDVAIKYLKPAPLAHGDLIIKRENQLLNNLPPPQIIRQIPHRPVTPEPIVLREKPPVPPTIQPEQVVTVPVNVAPERKVIIEKMAQLPPKPPPIIIERWLPYDKPKRVVLDKTDENSLKIDKEKNIVIEWQAPSKPIIRRQVRYTGVLQADPNEYTKRFGNSLLEPAEVYKYDYVELVNKIEHQKEANSPEMKELISLRNELEKLKAINSNKHNKESERRNVSSSSSLISNDVEYVGNLDALNYVRNLL